LNIFPLLSHFACFPGTQTNGLDFQKQPVPVGGAISTAQAQAFLGHLHQVECFAQPEVKIRQRHKMLGPGQVILEYKTLNIKF
jgi:hypothetical protein